MIDQEFSPDRLQLRALGHLLQQAQNYPLMPSIRESELYSRVYMGSHLPITREPWLTELERHQLLLIMGNELRVTDPIGEEATDVALTASGIFYTVSRAALMHENAHAPTDDFPREIVDGPWAIQQYFSPNDGVRAQGDVMFDLRRDQEKYENAVRAMQNVIRALASDNEIGDQEPLVRDQKLEELQRIRALLEKDSEWSGKLIGLGWATLGFLAAHFADRPVGKLADEAWLALQALVA